MHIKPISFFLTFVTFHQRKITIQHFICIIFAIYIFYSYFKEI